MAKTYDQIQNAVKAGNIMDWTNALQRKMGVPVDITEVYNSYNEAVKYAADNPVAYQGQIITVTENGDTTAYVITPAVQGQLTVEEVEYNIYLKPIGSTDIDEINELIAQEFNGRFSDANNSLTLRDDYYPELIGQKDAPTNTVPYKTADGKLAWASVEAIGGGGDGNAVVTSNDGTVSITSTTEESTKVTTYDLSIQETIDTINQTINQKIAGVFIYKGSVENYTDLLTENLQIGDVYNITKASAADEETGAPEINAGDNVVWNGATWDVLAGIEDLSAYATNDNLIKNYYTNSQTDNIVRKIIGEELKENLFDKINEAEFTITEELSVDGITIDHTVLTLNKVPANKIEGSIPAEKIDGLEIPSVDNFIAMITTKHGNPATNKEEAENLIYDLVTMKKSEEDNLLDTVLSADDLVNTIASINEDHFTLTNGYYANGRDRMATLQLSDNIVSLINGKLNDITIYVGPEGSEQVLHDGDRLNIAAHNYYGVVRGASEENKTNRITVDSDGLMNITQLNMGTIKFINDTENILVLNGGQA